MSSASRGFISRGKESMFALPMAPARQEESKKFHRSKTGKHSIVQVPVDEFFSEEGKSCVGLVLPTDVSKLVHRFTLMTVVVCSTQL